ncbi:MAG: TraB/GumN family protein, partial [Rhodanobacteraceae bacterium]
RSNVPIESPTIKLDVDNPREAVNKFKDSSMDDLDCFRRTLDRIDSDVDNMAARANAWATADIETLRKLPDSDLRSACFAAVTNTELARERGIADIDVRLQRAWLEAASAALAKNTSSFARLPIDDLLAADGYIAKLRAKGYPIESPDDVPADLPADPAPTPP